MIPMDAKNQKTELLEASINFSGDGKYQKAIDCFDEILAKEPE